MPRPNTSTVSVYIKPELRAVLHKAAALENRSLSNFLFTCAMRRAEELGVRPFGLSNGRRVSQGSPDPA